MRLQSPSVAINFLEDGFGSKGRHPMTTKKGYPFLFSGIARNDWSDLPLTELHFGLFASPACSPLSAPRLALGTYVPPTEASEALWAQNLQNLPGEGPREQESIPQKKS